MRLRIVSTNGMLVVLLAVLGGATASRIHPKAVQKTVGQTARSTEAASLSIEEVQVKQPTQPVQPVHQSMNSPEADPLVQDKTSVSNGQAQPVHASGQTQPVHAVHQSMHSPETASLVEDKTSVTNRQAQLHHSEQPTQAVHAVHQSTHSPEAASLVQDNSSVTKGQAQLLAGVPHHNIKLPFLIGGITIFALFAVCFSYYLIDRFFLRKETNEAEPGQRKSQRRSHMHNGSKVYDWEQSASVIRLYISVPQGMTKDDLNIAIGASHIQIGCAGKAPFMMGELHDAVSPAESHWRLRSNGELQIKLQKAQSSSWPRILKTE